MLDTFMFILDMCAKAYIVGSFEVTLITKEGLQRRVDSRDVKLQTSLHCCGEGALITLMLYSLSSLITVAAGY
jgi:hypothetical protein